MPLPISNPTSQTRNCTNLIIPPRNKRLVREKQLNFFDGLKVLDLGQGISAPFCAKMLGDLGAIVIKIEPPTGDRARKMGPFPDDLPDQEKSGVFLSLNTNKLGITLNLETPEARKLLARLIEETDIIIENFPPNYLTSLGLDFEAMKSHNPSLILTSISPFGQSGPWANYAADNLIISNLSGFSRIHPGPVDDLDKQPPLQLAAHQSEFIAGITAAAATSIAVTQKLSTGLGSHIDLSEIESLSVLPQTGLTEYAEGNPSRGRHKRVAGIESLRAILPCSDGYVSISPRQQDQWERLIEMMEHPVWANDSRFETRAGRVANWKALEPLLSAWTSKQTKEHVYREAQSRHIPSFPMNAVPDLLVSPQFAARNFFVSSKHPVAGELTLPGWPFQTEQGNDITLSPAPLLGQHNQLVMGANGLGLDIKNLGLLKSINAI